MGNILARTNDANRKPILAALLALAIVLFGLLSYHFQFVQDDAYISFRYAENLINGHGLVFNVGERVEGYTNFLWIIGLVVFKKLVNSNYILTARIFGFVSGAALFLITMFLIYRHDNDKAVVHTIYAFILLLACAAIPYWSVSGLETAAFAFMALAAMTAELFKPRLTAVMIVVATLLRPDGIVIFVVILLHRLLSDRQNALNLIMVYVILLLPFAIFKVLYYGSLLPNTFYAKSGLGWPYVEAGWNYAMYFFKTVGVYGSILIPVALAIPALWRIYRPLYLFIIIYSLYIVLVGGDVLKVYRFFVPVIPVLFLLFIISLDFALEKVIDRFDMKIRRKSLILTPLVLIFATASYLLAGNHVNTFLANERAFTSKMHFAADMIKRYMGPSFSIAASTIGVLGYELPGHRLIDMVGLTDSYIARHGEYIPGLESTWKERRYNSRYVLEQQPDVIIFSTNDKPSAPAERALFLHSEFRKNYVVSGFHRNQGQRWTNFFMKNDDYDADRDNLLSEAGFVNILHDALTKLSEGNHETALELFAEAAAKLPPDEYAFLHYYRGECLYRMEQSGPARQFFESALAAYPDDCRPRWRLGQLAAREGDTATVNRLTGEIKKLQPWLLDFSR
jgi:hypothetical protein